MEHLSGVVWSLSRGFSDSLRGTLVLFYLDKSIREKANKKPPKRLSTSGSNTNTPQRTLKEPEEPTILKRTLQCCALNGGVFWASLLFFEVLLLPFLKMLVNFSLGDSSSAAQQVWFWMYVILSSTFSAIWVLPLFLLSKIVNSLWFMDIAESAYRHTRGRPQTLRSVSRSIADNLFSLLVQVLFLLQAVLVCIIPSPFGTLLYFIHMCMLYSLYSFEYRWVNAGWELHRRLTYIENNWPYFIGFGLPLALLTSLPSSYIVSGCVFSILFPLFIVSGNEANPIIGIP
ncbi:UNVERIFIED_CONTAM: hypothetical protein PYX00_009634 [Menopon gallinae]